MASSTSDAVAHLPPQLLNQLPGLTPPSGVTPNFVDPPSHGDVFIIYASIMLALVLILFSVRIYTKAYIIRKWTWDDLSCSLGVLFTIFNFIVDVPLAELVSRRTLITDYVEESLVFAPLVFIKLAFFLFYLDVFWPQRWFRFACHAGAIFTALFYIAATIVMLALTTPHSDESWEGHGLSSDQSKALDFTVASSAVGFVIDLYLIILPTAAVSQLKLPFQKKVGASVMFLTGILAALSSLLTLYYRHKVTVNPDVSWEAITAQIVVMTELYAGIICLCLPPLAKALSHHNLVARIWGLSSRAYSARSRDSSKRQDSERAAITGATEKSTTTLPTLSGTNKHPSYTKSPAQSRPETANDDTLAPLDEEASLIEPSSRTPRYSKNRYTIPDLKRFTPLKEMKRSWYMDDGKSQSTGARSEFSRTSSQRRNTRVDDWRRSTWYRESQVISEWDWRTQEVPEMPKGGGMDLREMLGLNGTHERGSANALVKEDARDDVSMSGRVSNPNPRRSDTTLFKESPRRSETGQMPKAPISTFNRETNRTPGPQDSTRPTSEPRIIPRVKNRRSTSTTTSTSRTDRGRTSTSTTQPVIPRVSQSKSRTRQSINSKETDTEAIIPRVSESRKRSKTTTSVRRKKIGSGRERADSKIDSMTNAEALTSHPVEQSTDTSSPSPAQGGSDAGARTKTGSSGDSGTGAGKSRETQRGHQSGTGKAAETQVEAKRETMGATFFDDAESEWPLRSSPATHQPSPV
ncbi:MAG: hypothetical protein Q9162_007217 [Coniocarpon cinnabarinum]